MSVLRSIRLPLVTLALVASCALALARPELAERLAFERARLAAEPWRFLTGHLVHPHAIAAVDLVLLAALGAWWERRSRATLVAVLLASASLASVAVLLFTGFARYGGSSALSAGLFVAAALELARGARPLARAAGVLALVLFAAKVALELAGHGALFVELPPDLRVAAPAHAAGGLEGALVGLAAVARRPGPGRVRGSPLRDRIG